MVTELFNNLVIQMAHDYDETDEKMNAVLLYCAERAIGTFKSYMNYPGSFSQERIEEDMKANIHCLEDIAMYHASKHGVEFVDSYSESGQSRTWQSEADIYAMHGIVPYASL